MNSKLKIKLDECRISHLFETESPIAEDELEHRLIEKKYKINKDRIITRPPLQAVILNFARKGGIDVIYEKLSTPTFVGVMGKNHTHVITEFENLKHILEDIDGFILEESVGMEAVLSCKVFGEIKPDNVLPFFANSDVKQFSDQLNTDFTIDNFTLKNRNSNSIISIHVAPLYRDRRYFYVQLVFKDKSFENIINFVEDHERYINKIMQIISNNGH